MADPIRDWLAAFPKDYAVTQLAELDRRRAEIDEEAAKLRAFLDELGDLPPTPGINGNGATPSGMTAVEAAMARHPGRIWQRREIHQELVALGWIEPGEQGRKRLGSMLHHMVRSGRVERPEQNRYRLPDRQGVLAA
jgi:hypothetical protein